MNLTRKLEILNTLADADRGFPVNRVYRDGNLALATSGYQLLVFLLSNEERESPEFIDLPALEDIAKAQKDAYRKKLNRKSAERVRKWLAQEATNGKTMDSMALYQFLRVEKYLHCPYCSGSGVRPVAEPDMGFDGVVIKDEFDKPRPILVFGAPYNATMLVSMLAYLPASETVGLSTWAEPRERQSDLSILRITGDGWVIVQAALHGVEAADAEAFPLETVAIAEVA